MKSTTPKFKQIMAAGTYRDYLIKIDLTLADNTVLHLTEADIWEDSFGIETASSGTSSFDLGTAVIGKCTFTINNINGDFDNYDFFNANAVVWLGLVGDATGSPAVQQYYRMGFFTVDEPQKANGLISLELLDNMWKFDVPLSGVTLNYPVTAINAVNAICSYCGVTLAGTSANFHGYNFSIAEAPKDVDNINCREMLQYIAMIGCNFCIINDAGELEIKWYDVNATASTTDVFDLNQSTSFGTEDIEITGVKFEIDKTEYTIGTDGYRLVLTNPLVTVSNVSSVLNLIWDVLENFTLRTFRVSNASDLAVEVGDKCKIKDYKGNYVYSYITLNSFKLAGHSVQCNAQAPTRNLTTRYSQTVQAAVEVARKQTNEIISNFDLEVQMMNELAVNAMGGYQDYEDAPSGGRIWYLSNMPITKTQGVCSFEPNSTVFKTTGSGFFVSTDGGTTWVNGYNTQTGKLVVNVLSAIGIQFDWARGGTLTLGGYGNGNGVLSILDSNNVEKVHGDNTGLKVGANTGSKLFLDTNGNLKYYLDNAYGGEMTMEGVNYGTQEDPDIRDTFLVHQFDDISIETEDSNSYIRLRTDADDSNKGSLELYARTPNPGGTGTYTSIRMNGSGIHLWGDLYRGVSKLPTDLNVYSVNPFTGAISIYEFENGLFTGKTEHPDVMPHFFWHEWESQTPGVYNDAFILAAGTTSVTFPEIVSTNTYEPYIQCADGQSPPKITDMVKSGTQLTVTFTEVTAAQAAGNACVIKLMEYVL